MGFIYCILLSFLFRSFLGTILKELDSSTYFHSSNNRKWVCSHLADCLHAQIEFFEYRTSHVDLCIFNTAQFVYIQYCTIRHIELYFIRTRGENWQIYILKGFMVVDGIKCISVGQGYNSHWVTTIDCLCLLVQELDKHMCKKYPFIFVALKIVATVTNKYPHHIAPF